MNNRLLTTATLIASSLLFLSGCDGDNSSFETPNTDISSNPGTVSQNNFTIFSEDLTPSIFADPASNTFTYTELNISVQIGDRNNQLLTDAHTVYFKTEWGLLQQPSCVTVDGTCSIVWRTSSADDAPTDHKNTIMAYTIGEESFVDANGNGIFDDGDGNNFGDLEEPYVDSNRNLIYDMGEVIVDFVNDNNTTGEHDYGDFYFNGQGCTHTSLCSPTQPTIFVWDDVQISMDGPP